MIFMVTVIITVGMGFNWLVQEHLRASESLKSKAEAVVTARSAYDTLIYLLLVGQVHPEKMALARVEKITPLKSIPLDGSPVSLTPGVTARVQDSNGRLSLASFNTKAISRMADTILKVENPLIPVASFQDWIDWNNLTRANGAEAPYYKKEAKPYQPRNYAMQYKEEMSLIRGLSPEEFERIRPDVTLLPNRGFNPNTATDNLLKTYLRIDDQKLKKIKKYKSQPGRLLTRKALEALIGHKLFLGRYDIYNYSPSLYADITISAGQPKSMYKIEAGVALRQNSFAPYSILYWREE
jgi:general secretion pathway protein K